MSPTLTTLASALLGALAGAAATALAAWTRLAGHRWALRSVVHQLHHDPLTGLPNRAALLAHLDAALHAGTPVAVALLDLDRFKAVNDNLGHHAGDELLCQIAERLHRLPPPVRLAARLQGDEFVLLTDGPAAATVADAAWQAIAATPFTVAGGHQVRVTASIGLAVATPGTDHSRLLRHADQAMYRAKHTRDRVVPTDALSHPPMPNSPTTRLRDGRTPPHQPPADQS